MAAFDTTRPHYGSTASANQIGSIFLAVFDTPRPQGSAFGRLGAVLASAFGSVLAWNDTRLTRKSLGALTDRELDDIGLTRAEIDLVARRR